MPLFTIILINNHSSNQDKLQNEKNFKELQHLTPGHLLDRTRRFIKSKNIFFLSHGVDYEKSRK